MKLPASGLLAGKATIHAAETIVGSALDVGAFETLVLHLDYTKGDETGVYVKVYYVGPDGVERQVGSWTGSGNLSYSAEALYLTASGTPYAQFDVGGIKSVKVYELANGGTPTGTLGVSWSAQ